MQLHRLHLGQQMNVAQTYMLNTAVKNASQTAKKVAKTDASNAFVLEYLLSSLPWPEVMEEVVVQVVFAGSKGKQLKLNLK
jgi:hypothetical protein